MIQLKSNHLILNLDPQTACLTLESRDFPNTSLRTRFQVTGKLNGVQSQLIKRSHSEPSTGVDSQNPIIENKENRVRYALPTIVNGLQVILNLTILADGRLAALRFDIYNHTPEPLDLERISFLDIPAGNLNMGSEDKPQPAFFSNGWQSWSSSRTYTLGEKQQTSHLGPFQNPMVVNPGTPKPKKRNHFSSDMFTLCGDQQSRAGLVAGFLTQKTHFGSLEARFHPEIDLKMWANGDGARLNPGQSISTDWGVMGFVSLDDPDPLEPYLKAVAEAHQVNVNPSEPVGWCSWYHFYQDITEEIIKSNLDAVKSLETHLPLPLFQIDDGFETYPGDWFDFVPGFPNGVQPLAAKANSEGLTPGIWLAPYIVHPKAKLVKEHPDWLLRDKGGKPVTAGFVWNAFTYALDLTHPEALAYTCEVIRTAVNDWGFDYLKLDFLYAAALDGAHKDPTQTRAQVLRKGLEALREAAGPDVTLLACGCPLGSALGLFDAMRISADVSGHWRQHFPPVSPLLKKEPHMPSAQNALRNTLTRAPLHRQWWINDPDCLLVRPGTDLTLAEVQTLGTVIGITGGSLLLSDDLPGLPEDRLAIAQALLPLIKERAQVLDWFESGTPAKLRLDLEGPFGPWHLLVRINWEDRPADLSFSLEDYKLSTDHPWWLREFWTAEIGLIDAGSSHTFKNVPAHGVRVIALRSYQPDLPTYLGSGAHLSQGMEVSHWEVKKDSLKVGFKLGRTAAGSVFLYLPVDPKTAFIKDQQYHLEPLGQGIYQLTLDNLEDKLIELFW